MVSIQQYLISNDMPPEQWHASGSREIKNEEQRNEE
jgi:hypothetical protein